MRRDDGQMTDGWDTPVGTLLSRDERMAKYGGARYGGIEPSGTTPNVFVYSDPARGAAYGYNFDGWNEEQTVFLYTGEGRVGDQLMKEGNRAVLSHRDQSRALRVFIADGLVPGTAQKNHRYIGQFEIDPSVPYTQEDAPDENRETRTVFVFRLLPVGEVLRREADLSETGGASRTTTSQLVDPETHTTPSFATAGSQPTTAQRRENELVSRYRIELEHAGHKVGRWRITPAGEVQSLLTDIFDEDTNELYEAKGTASRDAIRRAIGQLFDYRRHIPRPGLALVMLLPHRPSEDLMNLIIELGIGCVYERPEGGFERVQP
jgi:hypothetical protein